jgi:hypothetical protein
VYYDWDLCIQHRGRYAPGGIGQSTGSIEPDNQRLRAIVFGLLDSTLDKLNRYWTYWRVYVENGHTIILSGLYGRGKYCYYEECNRKSLHNLYLRKAAETTAPLIWTLATPITGVNQKYSIQYY